MMNSALSQDMKVEIEDVTKENILQALENSLSENQVLRQQSMTYMTIYLEGQEQFMTIICLKNSIFRNIQGAINRPGQKPTVLFDGDLKAKLKSFLINIVSSSSATYPFNVFQQTLEIVRIFVKFDFPNLWPELIEHILNTFQSVAANFDSINAENIEDLYRFLTLYNEILKEQNIKKLATKRELFVRQAKVHLEHIYPLWENIDLKQWNEDTIENFSEDDKITFVITKLLDKCIILIMCCGFNINDLANKDDNIYVKMIEKLTEKLSFLVNTIIKIIEKVSWKFSETCTNLLTNYYKCLNSLILKLSDFQYSEPLVFYTCFESYLESLITIIAKNSYFDEKCQKASMLAIFRVLNTFVYNHTNYDTKNGEFKEITLESSGIINTSAKFANFQNEVKTCIIKYRSVFHIGKYLKLDCLDLWEDDPEGFIENEDDLQVYRESSITNDCSFNFLSYAICNKILNYFTDIFTPWLIEYLTHIIETRQPIEKLCKIAYDEETKDKYSEEEISMLIEDAIISLVGLLPSICNNKSRNGKTPEEDKFKIETLLNHLEYRIECTDNKIFKRRYCLLLSIWSNDIHFASLLDYLAKSCSLLFSTGSDDIVILFEALNVFRDILRVLEDTRKQHKNKAITEDDSVKIIEIINERLNYKELFESIAPLCIEALNKFNSPTQIWRCVNLVSLLIEGCKDTSDEHALEHFKNINFIKMITLDSPLLKEAIYDMCKNLVSIFKSSMSILEINFKLLEHNIKACIEYELFDLWLYVMRIFELDNNQVARLVCSEFLANNYYTLCECGMNSKYSVLVSEILVEYILADLVPQLLHTSPENNLKETISIQSIIEYCIEAWLTLNKTNLEDVDIYSSNLMERKEHLIKVLIAIFMKHIEGGPHPESETLLATFEKAFMIIFEEVCSKNYDSGMQHLSSYFTQLLVLLNRGIIISEAFRDNIFRNENHEKSKEFLNNWFSNMSFLMLNYARRINQLAIIHALPLLTKEMVADVFPKISSLIFSAIESDIYIKESKKMEDFYSPEKIEGYETVSIVKNVNAKGSKRLATLRSEDKLMTMGLTETFIQNLQSMCINLEITENDLASLLETEKEKTIFLNIVKESAKYYN